MRFFYPSDTLSLRVRYDAWSLGIGLRDVVPIIRSLLDEIFFSHKYLLRLYANLLCQPRHRGWPVITSSFWGFGQDLRR
jgi:hypothetical protein